MEDKLYKKSTVWRKMGPALYNTLIFKILSKLLSLIKVQTLIFLKGRVGGKKHSLSFDGLKKEKMFVPLTDWLMNNQISQLECWGGNLVARHAPNPWNSASLM